MLFTGDANGADILRALYAAGYAPPGGRVHLDVLVLPHFGSRFAMPPEFLQRVTADHYVVHGSWRFRVPKPELIADLHHARGSDPYALYVVIGDKEGDVRRDLERAARAAKAAGSRATLSFPPSAKRSQFINLLGRVTY